MKKKINKKIIKIKTKTIIVLIAIFILLFTLVTTFGRYVYNLYHNYILETKGFFFNSSVMSANGTKHSINNWDGVNAYLLTIDVNNKKNELLSTDVDISYEIGVDCSSNIRCVLNKTEGIITTDSKVDSYTITIYPVTNFTSNQTAEVKTYARSTSPYIKEISTTYNIGIETSNFSYKIIDSPNSKYLTIEFTNAFTYYKVINAFGTYQVGDNISIDDYQNLTNDEKQNCTSAEITIDYDPNVILLDMTDTTYKNRIANSERTEVINNHNYVNGFSFKMEASSNNKIIFYKLDSTQNFSFPGNNPPVIDVDTYTVEDMN
jgi:hypothetical protein